MALFPCDQHGSRYTGKQRTAYPAIVNGGHAFRRRRRLCADCFIKLSAWCQSRLELVEGDSLGISGCVGCHVDDAPYAVFVTLYDQGAERVDFYGRCCAPCRDGVVGMALFGAQEALAGL